MARNPRNVTLQQVAAAQPATTVSNATWSFVDIVANATASADGQMATLKAAAAEGLACVATLGDEHKKNWQSACRVALVAGGMGEKSAETLANSLWKFVRLGKTGNHVAVFAALDGLPLVNDTYAQRVGRAATYVLKDSENMKGFLAYEIHKDANGKDVRTNTGAVAWYTKDRADSQKAKTFDDLVKKAQNTLATTLPKAMATMLFGEKAKIDQLPKSAMVTLQKATEDYMNAYKVFVPAPVEEDTEEETTSQEVAPTPAATSPIVTTGGGIMRIADLINLGFTEDEAKRAILRKNGLV